MNKYIVVSFSTLILFTVLYSLLTVTRHNGYIKGCEGVMVNMLHAFDVKNIDYADLERFCEDQRTRE
jgi:hypothetical protein